MPWNLRATSYMALSSHCTLSLPPVNKSPSLTGISSSGHQLFLQPPKSSPRLETTRPSDSKVFHKGDLGFMTKSKLTRRQPRTSPRFHFHPNSSTYACHWGILRKFGNLHRFSLLGGLQSIFSFFCKYHEVFGKVCDSTTTRTVERNFLCDRKKTQIHVFSFNEINSPL